MYQHIRDMNKLTQRDKLHEDLVEYHRLKRRWGLGHIKITLSKCSEKYCRYRPKRILHENMRHKHTLVLGRYLDENNRLRWEFLGSSLKDAHARLEYVLLFYR